MLDLIDKSYGGWQMEQIIHAHDIHGYFDGLASYLTGSEVLQGSEHKILLSPLLGTGSITRQKIRPGIEVVLSDMTLQEDWKQYITEDQVFEIHYCFSGNTDCFVNGKSFSTEVRPCNFYSMETTELYLHKKSKQKYQCLEIRMSPEQLLRYFEGENDYAYVQKWLQKQLGNITPLKDTVMLKRAVHEIVNSTYQGSMKRLHLESKIMEMLLLVLDNGLQGAGSWPVSKIKKQDRERLYAARQMIEERLENPLSLKELARATELNEFKLKTGFKELFGMTVFEYLRDLRLEKGMLLMRIDQLNVGEAAIAVGYSNPSNFSAAFYKKYGCNPLQYRKST